MIRLTYVLRRKPDTSHEDFKAYWLHEHGPRVQAAAEQLGIRRYVQLHNLEAPEAAREDPYRGEMLKPFDGVAEFWFDSLSSLLATSERRDKISDELISDELQFIHHAQSAGWIAYESPQVNPTKANVIASPDSDIAKLFYVLNAPDGQEMEAIQWYWRVQHGPLVRSVAEAIQALKYIQVHRLPHEFNDNFAASRGTMDSFYGHAELWFDLSKTPHPGRAAAAELLYQDEMHFIDFSRSASWLTKEHRLVDTLQI